MNKERITEYFVNKIIKKTQDIFDNDANDKKQDNLRLDDYTKRCLLNIQRYATMIIEDDF